MLRGPPRKRLDCESRIPGAARPHDRGTEDAEIRNLVRETAAVNDIGLGVVAHTCSAVGVRGNAGRSHRPANHLDSACGQVPLFHFLLREFHRPLLVLFWTAGKSGIPDHLADLAPQDRGPGSCLRMENSMSAGARRSIALRFG